MEISYVTINFQWPDRPVDPDPDQNRLVAGCNIHLQIVTRHLLISAVLATFVLTVMGCGKSGISGHETDSLKPSGGDEENARKLAVGDKAPDFEVEVLGGESLRLSSFLGEANGPTVLLFNRAHW